MAVDLWTSEGISPRISFSHDLRHAETVPLERHRSDSLLMENTDFHFCTSNSFEQESSFAEELFSEGKIIPLEEKIVFPHDEVKKQNDHPKPPSPPSTKKFKKESLKEIMEKNSKAEEKPSSSKSFWRFKRSSSCGSGNARSLICSLPLLSRSNSAPNPKKEHHKNSHKPPLSNSSTKSSSSSSSSSTTTSSSVYGYPYSSVPKKFGAYGNGGRISPILNVPPPYISRGTVNLFGLGSLFCNGKEKSKRK